MIKCSCISNKNNSNSNNNVLCHTTNTRLVDTNKTLTSVSLMTVNSFGLIFKALTRHTQTYIYMHQYINHFFEFQFSKFKVSISNSNFYMIYKLP